MLEYATTYERIAHDPTFTDLRGGCLELGFDQREKATAGHEQGDDCIDDVRYARKGNIADDQIAAGAIAQRGQIDHIRPLKKRDALIVSQRPCELRPSNIDCNYRGRTALKKAIGEAARRAPDISARKARRIHAEGIERTLELKTSPPNIGKTPLDMQRKAWVDHHAG